MSLCEREAPAMTVIRSKSGVAESFSASTKPVEESIDHKYSYESAIQALNSLQTNAATLQKIRRERQNKVQQNLPTTRQYLQRSGMTLEDLDSVKTIHVSGTKGKGSTCAFCESILRQHGLRTGFYSSPHLVSATERVRLSGQPIDKLKFTKYFWDVYDRVCGGRGAEDRPPYFQFLTILAFNIFFREKVDVAIIEVGIGGEYDCTNIIRNPTVTGITALGIDHTHLLGNKITEIAWHKAGIMKQGVFTYIDGQQDEDALKVLSSRGEELGSAGVLSVPSLQEYHWGRFPMILGLYGKIQERNGSIALALARHFLASIGRSEYPKFSDDLTGENIKVMEPFKMTAEYALGLRLTDWPGRNQLIDQGRILYMLDGAHTTESILACRSWFSAASKLAIRDSDSRVFKVLVFNTTGERDPRLLLQPFINSDFDLAIFCTNLTGNNGPVDQQNFSTTNQIQLSRCKDHLHVWTKLQTEPSTSTLLNAENIQKTVSIPGMIMPRISDALNWISQGTNLGLQETMSSIPSEPVPQDLVNADQVHVLVTGSLHLVGGAIASLQTDGLPVKEDDPKLVSKYHTYSSSSVPGMM